MEQTNTKGGFPWLEFFVRLSTLSSGLKYHALVFAFIALLCHCITGTDFTVVASLVISGRVITDIKWNGSMATPSAPTTTTANEQPSA